MKKLSRGGALAAAVIWTVITILWTVTTMLRVLWDYGDQGLWVVTVLTLLASLLACAANWYRYINYNKPDQ